MAERTKIQHFILIFDRQARRLVEQIDFGNRAAAAVTRYGEIEALYWDQPHMDIVLVGSDSIDTIKVTHANYFEDDTSVMSNDLLRLAY